MSAILLKKFRIRKHDDVKVFLTEIEKQVKRPSDGEMDSYDRIIITEFPNVMKFSKKLRDKEDGM